MSLAPRCPSQLRMRPAVSVGWGGSTRASFSVGHTGLLMWGCPCGLRRCLGKVSASMSEGMADRPTPCPPGRPCLLSPTPGEGAKGRIRRRAWKPLTPKRGKGSSRSSGQLELLGRFSAPGHCLLTAHPGQRQGSWGLYPSFRRPHILTHTHQEASAQEALGRRSFLSPRVLWKSSHWFWSRTWLPSGAQGAAVEGVPCGPSPESSSCGGRRPSSAWGHQSRGV